MLGTKDIQKIAYVTPLFISPITTITPLNLMNSFKNIYIYSHILPYYKYSILFKSCNVD